MIIYKKPEARRGRRRVAGLFATFTALGIAAAACTGSYADAPPPATAVAPPATSSPATSSPATSPATAPSATLSTDESPFGDILVDSKGRTLYAFAKDGNGTSVCNGECANDWPPLAAPASLPMSLPGVTGQIGMTTRQDGTQQLTVAGHPLYTFEGDTAPGQTNGQGLVLNGGRWTVVSAAGAPIWSAKAAPATWAPVAGSAY